MQEPGAVEAIPAEEGISRDFLTRGRLLLMVVAFGVEVGLFLFGLFGPLDPGTRQILANQTSGEFAQISAAGPLDAAFLIFSHNALIGLIDAIPLLGALFFAYSIYTTGLVAQALLASQGVPSAFGVIVFLLPYSLVEFSAYAVAVGAGTMLLVQLGRRRFVREFKVFLFEGLLVLLLLIIAAAMEEATDLSPAFGFALWIPTGLAAVGIILLARRRLR